MKVCVPVPVGRALLGLLSLSLGLSVLPAAPVGHADEQKVAIEAKWLFLRKEDVKNDQMVQIQDRVTDQGRAILTERRYDPQWKGAEDHPAAPTLTLNRIWQATDIATAHQIFEEQANAGFPEARGDVQNLGGLTLPLLGEEARGISGCTSECAVVHTRIVFRYLNAVEVLYVYGPRDYAYREISVGWAQILDERVRSLSSGTVQTGPAPDVIYTVFPRQLAITALEVGANTDEAGSGEGSDGRSQWYWTRVKRSIKDSVDHLGPADVYTKVWVATDIESARAIYAEQAVTKMPEAEQVVGTQFPMDFTPGVGNENFGWSACNDNCNTEKYDRLHHRYVLRVGNVVMVIYNWGENQSTSINQIEYYARQMRSRLPAS